MEISNQSILFLNIGSYEAGHMKHSPELALRNLKAKNKWIAYFKTDQKLY